MAEPETSTVFELRVPALPEHVATVRLFLATIGRSMGLSEEIVDDLKLVASEAASVVILGGRGPELTVTAMLTGAGLDVAVGPVADPPPDTEGVQPMDVIGALFPEARIVRGVIRFAVALGES